MLAIEGATIYTLDRVIERGWVLVADGRIRAVGTADTLPPVAGARFIDAHGHLLLPGFFDLQLNGGFGRDFTQQPGSIWEVAAELPRYGVTAFLPTLVTSPPETVRQVQDVLVQGPPAGFAGAWPLGLHLEGPFLNPGKKGAHHPRYLRPPSLPHIVDWSPGNGVRLVTLAPELPGAIDVVTALADRGVVVAAGHSLAGYTEAQVGIEAGISYGTHLFNAMAGLHHRRPGLIGALLADERVTVGLIADGVHVHPALVKLVWQLVGNGRLNLVTDAMAALGMPAGAYPLGNFQVTVDETSARLSDGTLAGSILSLNVALRNLMTFAGCSLTEALPAVTTTPFALLGLGQRKGQITPGYDADFVLLTPDLTVVCTIVAGQIVYQNNELLENGAISQEE